MQVYSDELYHFGVKGMKWGRRKTYGVMPKMITKKRQLDADKRTLDKMNNENHSVSFGITKKRQAAYDERDKKILEKRIDKNTKKLNKQSEQKKNDENIMKARQDTKKALEDYNKKAYEANLDMNNKEKVKRAEEAFQRFAELSTVGSKKTSKEIETERLVQKQIKRNNAIRRNVAVGAGVVATTMATMSFLDSL